MWEPLFATLPAQYAEVVMLWLIILTGLVIAGATVSLYIILTGQDLWLKMKRGLASLCLTTLITLRSLWKCFSGLPLRGSQ